MIKWLAGDSMKKRYVIVLLTAGLIILGSVSALLLLDFPYQLHYTVSPSQTKPNTLTITMDVQSSLFSRGKAITFYTGDKAVTLKASTDGGGLQFPVSQQEDNIGLYLGRAKKVTLIYEVQIASSGKHGYRGYSTENYCVFDGGQAFLLPMEYYQEGYPPDKAVVGRLSVTMKARRGWLSVFPYTELKNVTWFDAYSLNSDSFFMGACTLIGEKDGLKIYAVSQSEKAIQDTAVKGIAALYNYYADLFSFRQKPYQVILLPSAGESGFSVIGGAGTGSVCATFDPAKRRDWELLSHRMFHAYFDTALRVQEIHKAPRLWFYEGLVTYYENRSMAQLPKEIQVSADIRPEQEFTSLFNKYLYMRTKDAAQFSLAPMEEQRIRDSKEGGPQIEFLHYIQAPLVVRMIEDLNEKRTGKHDALLMELLKNRGSSSLLSWRELLARVLGNDAEPVYQKYFLSNEFLPLWYLRDSNYSEQRTLNDLNDIDYLLATWMMSQQGQIPYEELNLTTVRKIKDRPEWGLIHFSDSQTEQNIEKYSPVIHALLKEYALRANICNLSLNNPALRNKLLLDKDNIVRWDAWMNSVSLPEYPSN